MTEFYVGQKVVCISIEPLPETLPFDCGECPTVGEVYTIKRMVMVHNHLCFHLYEIERDAISRLQIGPDVGYGAWRFRPLDSKAISIFRKIARDVTDGKKVRIDA